MWASETLPQQLPAADVPTEFASRNVDLHKWNTVYWDKQAHALHPGDQSYAVVTKWLRNPSNLYVLGVTSPRV